MGCTWGCTWLRAGNATRLFYWVWGNPAEKDEELVRQLGGNAQRSRALTRETLARTRAWLTPERRKQLRSSPV
eukprot:gene16787-4632_t